MVNPRGRRGRGDQIRKLVQDLLTDLLPVGLEEDEATIVVEVSVGFIFKRTVRAELVIRKW